MSTFKAGDLAYDRFHKMSVRVIAVKKVRDEDGVFTALEVERVGNPPAGSGTGVPMGGRYLVEPSRLQTATRKNPKRLGKRKNPFTANDAWGVVTTDTQGHIVKDQGFYRGDNAQDGMKEAVADLKQTNRDGRVYLLKVEHVTPVASRGFKERAQAKARAAAEGAAKDFTRLAGSLVSWAQRKNPATRPIIETTTTTARVDGVDMPLHHARVVDLPNRYIGGWVMGMGNAPESAVRAAIQRAKEWPVTYSLLQQGYDTVVKPRKNPLKTRKAKARKHATKASQKRRDLVTTAGGPQRGVYQGYADAKHRNPADDGLTKPGRHGTLHLYVVTIKPGDPGHAPYDVRRWGYSAEHVDEKMAADPMMEGDDWSVRRATSRDIFWQRNPKRRR